MTDEKNKDLTDTTSGQSSIENGERTQLPDSPEEQPRIVVTDRRFWARKKKDPEEAQQEKADVKPKQPAYVAELEERLKNAEEQLVKLSTAYKNQQQENAGFRERLTKNMEIRLESHVADLIKNLLEPLDNFERSLAFAHQGTDHQALLTGVEMIYNQFLTTLNTWGVEQMQRMGTIFDPHLDEVVAMTERTHPDQEPHTIVDELQKGYLYKGNLLRPSKVRVVKPD